MVSGEKQKAPEFPAPFLFLSFVMARFMRAIHTVTGLWMARTSRAMTIG
jgi:hypothetical protein